MGSICYSYISKICFKTVIHEPSTRILQNEIIEIDKKTIKWTTEEENCWSEYVFQIQAN